VEAGIDAASFWQQTPRETFAALRSSARRQARLAVATAWHTAVLSRLDRLPPLRELMAQLDGEADGGQSADEQLDAARAMVAAFGAEGSA
jgi:hypothetical protein